MLITELEISKTEEKQEPIETKVDVKEQIEEQKADTVDTPSDDVAPF